MRGLFQYGDLHFGQTRGSFVVLGNHWCPHRPHFFNSTVITGSTFSVMVSLLIQSHYIIYPNRYITLYSIIIYFNYIFFHYLYISGSGPLYTTLYTIIIYIHLPMLTLSKSLYIINTYRVVEAGPNYRAPGV